MIEKNILKLCIQRVSAFKKYEVVQPFLILEVFIYHLIFYWR